MRSNRVMGTSALIGTWLLGCSSSGASADAAVEKMDASSVDVGAPLDAKKAGDAARGPDAGKVQAADAAVDSFQKGSSDAKEAMDAAVHEASAAEAAAPGPEELLITFGGPSTTSELVSVNVATKAVDGRLGFLGFGITDARNVSAPFLLEQNADIVARLDPAAPWKSEATWNVGLTDAIDGGSLYSAALQVVTVGTKTYVIRYDRNDIAVIDSSASADAAVPLTSISLATFVQGGDSDGLVEMMGAAYVASSSRLYVVLANINQATEATYGAVICSAEVSTVVAIDTTTDTIVSLGGTGPSGSIPLVYYDPVNLAYDATGDRLIVVGSGCYAQPTPTLGAPMHRGVEALSLATGTSTSLLELEPSLFPTGFDDVPTGFVYIDSTHAVLGFDQTGEAVYLWNPTTSVLGAVVPNAPDTFTYDGKGSLLGTRLDTTDAGVMLTAVVSVALPGGASTTIATNVTSLAGAVYVSSVDVWPHP